MTESPEPKVERKRKVKQVPGAMGFAFHQEPVKEIEPQASKIFSNAVNTFMMITDAKIPLINTLSPGELGQFFENINLSKYKKSILFQKIDGEKILEFDEVDLEDNLGMQAQDEQNHLMLNINIASRDQ